MQKRLANVILAVYCLFGGAIAANAQFLFQRDASMGFAPLHESQTWGKMPDKDVMFPLQYHSRVRPESILIGRNHPNGTRFLAFFPHDGVPLPLKFGKDFHGFNDYGDLKPGYTVEIGEYRFVHDGGEPELIIAIGNGKTDLTVNILRYHAPRTAKDTARASNWTLEGSLHGQSTAIIQGSKISLSVGVYHDVFVKHAYHKGRFD